MVTFVNIVDFLARHSSYSALPCETYRPASIIFDDFASLSLVNGSFVLNSATSGRTDANRRHFYFVLLESHEIGLACGVSRLIWRRLPNHFNLPPSWWIGLLPAIRSNRIFLGIVFTRLILKHIYIFIADCFIYLFTDNIAFLRRGTPVYISDVRCWWLRVDCWNIRTHLVVASLVERSYCFWLQYFAKLIACRPVNHGRLDHSLGWFLPIGLICLDIPLTRSRSNRVGLIRLVTVCLLK